MIIRPQNWENVQAFTERRTLPVGAYVCKVRQASVQDTDYGQQLCILFDISEGEYAGYYNADFAASTLENKKWKGVLRQFLPRHDGSEKDGWTMSSLKGLLTAFEKSNPGYQWNWDEKSLNGKTIGIIFRNEEWDYQGKHGWAVRPYRATSAENVRNGDYTIPADKALASGSAATISAAPTQTAPAGGYVQVDDEELPF